MTGPVLTAIALGVVVFFASWRVSRRHVDHMPRLGAGARRRGRFLDTSQVSSLIAENEYRSDAVDAANTQLQR